MSSSRRSSVRVGTASSVPIASAVARRPRAAATARVRPPRNSSRLGFTSANGNNKPSPPAEPRTKRAAIPNNPCSVPGFATGTTIRSGRCTTSLTPSRTAASSPKLVGTMPSGASINRFTERSVRIGPKVAVTTMTANTLLSTVWFSRPA